MAASELLPTGLLPAWFDYPADFLALLRKGEHDVGPWRLLTGDWLVVRFNGIRNRYQDRDLVPFARRLDNDDIACWEGDKPDEVRVVHDFASPGWERSETYPNFEAWLGAARSEEYN